MASDMADVGEENWEEGNEDDEEPSTQGPAHITTGEAPRDVCGIRVRALPPSTWTIHAHCALGVPAHGTHTDGSLVAGVLSACACVRSCWNAWGPRARSRRQAGVVDPGPARKSKRATSRWRRS